MQLLPNYYYLEADLQFYELYINLAKQEWTMDPHILAHWYLSVWEEGCRVLKGAPVPAAAASGCGTGGEFRLGLLLCDC